RARPSASGAGAGEARCGRAQPQEREAVTMAGSDQGDRNPGDRPPPARPGGQTFQGLASLRQAMAAAARRDALGRSYATGKRKNAVARVWIKPGNGKIEINGRDSPVYFARPVLRMLINQPFVLTDRLGQFDVWCTVKGGGLSGQAGAVRHGISRALTF